MSEENKALVLRAWEELANQKNLDFYEEVYAPDAVWHEPDRDLRGLEEVKQCISTYFDAFPDVRVTVEDVIAEGDKVVSHYTYRGIHQGEVEAFGPPTGRQSSRASPCTASKEAR